MFQGFDDNYEIISYLFKESTFILILVVISIVLYFHKYTYPKEHGTDAFEELIISKVKEIKEKFDTSNKENIRKILEQQGIQEQYIKEIMKKL